MSKKMHEQFTCSSMMLPEHRDELKRRIKKLQMSERFYSPDFDEQQREEFDFLINCSINCGTGIKITARKGNDDILVITGVAKKKLPHPGRIEIETGGKTETLLTGDVLKIEKT